MRKEDKKVGVCFVNEFTEQVSVVTVSAWKPYSVFGYKEVVTFRVKGRVASMNKKDFKSVFNQTIETY